MDTVIENFNSLNKYYKTIKKLNNMKKSVFTLAITMLIGGTILTGCQSSAEKVENAENNLQEAKENVLEAKQDLKVAHQDSITEYQKFRIEYEERITANEKSIADFRARMAKEKKKTEPNMKKDWPH